jgi:hypothetical protein
VQQFTYFDPALTGWEKRWNLTAPWGTATGPTGSITGTCLAISGASSPRAAFAWVGAGEAADVEVLTRVHRTSTQIPESVGLIIRGSGTSSGDANGYQMKLSPSDGYVSIYKIVNGVGTSLAGSGGGYWSNAGWRWCRFRAVGSTIQFRSWRDDQQEPTTWRITVTDSTFTGPGWVAVTNGGNTGTKYWDLFSIGTDGDPAPTELVGTPRRKWRNASFGLLG